MTSMIGPTGTWARMKAGWWVSDNDIGDDIGDDIDTAGDLGSDRDDADDIGEGAQHRGPSVHTRRHPWQRPHHSFSQSH